MNHTYEVITDRDKILGIYNIYYLMTPSVTSITKTGLGVLFSTLFTVYTGSGMGGSAGSDARLKEDKGLMSEDWS